MKSQLIVLALLLGLSMPLYAALPEPQSQTEKIQTAYGQLPLSFEENQGQTDAHVKFLSRGQGYTLFLTATEAVLTIQRKVDSRAGKNPLLPPLVLAMGLSGANRAPAILGEESLPGKQNYLIGNDPKKWQTDISTYQKVKYQNVYPGIDLVYYGNQRQLEYDFVIAPKADPRKIELQFKGAERIEIDDQGNLVLSVQGKMTQLQKPIIYQDNAGKRQIIPGGYLLKGKEKVGFQVTAYDRTRPLIIDPVLGYSTYLGGSSFDGGTAIAVDRSGNAYITGTTISSDFPTTAGSFQTVAPSSDASNVFVTKLNPAGTAIIYSTYLGGTIEDPNLDEGDGYDEASGIAVDGLGNAYIIGRTNSRNYPVANAIQPAWATGGCGAHGVHSPCFDAFITKINPPGNQLVYSTYLGGTDDDQGAAIAVDAGGSAYIAGTTRSGNFPTANPIQRSFAGGNCGPEQLSDGDHPCRDAFVAKINSTGSALVYSTFLGGTGRESGNGIAVDPSGNAYVTGWTDSIDFPTANAIQPASGGGSCSRSSEKFIPAPCPDAFITKLNMNGSAFVYSTYLGGALLEEGRGIALDSSNQAYLTGQTTSVNFPVTAGAFQTTKGGSDSSSDAFVTKLNAAGSALIYSTYLGGIRSDEGHGIAVDASGHAYITGLTRSENFPTAFPIQASGGGCQDSNDCTFNAFVTAFNPAGSALIYSTYLTGRTGFTNGQGIAGDSFGNMYVTGGTSSNTFPTTPGVIQPSYQDGSDAFVSKIAVTHSYSDGFNRANSTTLGSNWNEYLGNLEIFNNTVRNTTAANKAAVYARVFGPDQAVSADCKLTEAGSSCGVMARWSSESNFYRARLDVGAQNIALYKTVNGTTTRLGISTRPLAFNTFYRIRLVVRGASVSAYFANESTPAISVSDTSLPSGNLAGIRSYASSVYATVFENFDVTTPLADTFNRTNSTSLGASWNEYLPDLEVFEGELRNVSGGGQPKAARYLTSVGPDQEIAVDCKVTAAGNACGLMGRWSDANNYYLLRLDAGAQNIALFKVVNGTTTRLGLVSRPLKFNTYYRLRLIEKRNRLMAFFGNESAAAISVTDSSLTSGSFAGIRAFASAADTTFFNNFDLTVAQ
ncbi:MAG: SBBP repeat-containing protein [Nitrospirae bacterium]|nr:SBBP repeat-containing protein [Candidatus Manganitrophaceae bacterium]